MTELGNEALQDGIFNQLQESDLSVYQYVPKEAKFPLVAMGEEYILDSSTKNNRLMEITHTIHAYSNSVKKTEINRMNQKIIGALEKLSSLDGGFYVSKSRLESSQTMIEDNGNYHSVVSFNFIIGKDE